jgi:hypothetical protein
VKKKPLRYNFPFMGQAGIAGIEPTTFPAGRDALKTRSSDELVSFW